MKPNFSKATLKLTAGDKNGFPKDRKPEIALSGRSNVGKSSLINTLIKRRNYAHVSGTPGKTITVNFYDIDDKFYLVDLPGYGFAKRTPAEKAKWSALTNGYFTEDCERISAVAQLIDLKVGPTEDDKMMVDFMNRSDIDYFVVATKTDKLNKTEREKAVKELCLSGIFRDGTEIILFSALTGEGRNEVESKILSCLSK